MEELLNLIGNYGAMVVIVALFLWEWVCTKKDTRKALEEMKNANINIAKSLELLQKSMENQEHIMQEHDKRSVEILSIVNQKKDK